MGQHIDNTGVRRINSDGIRIIGSGDGCCCDVEPPDCSQIPETITVTFSDIEICTDCHSFSFGLPWLTKTLDEPINGSFTLSFEECIYTPHLAFQYRLKIPNWGMGRFWDWPSSGGFMGGGLTGCDPDRTDYYDEPYDELDIILTVSVTGGIQITVFRNDNVASGHPNSRTLFWGNGTLAVGTVVVENDNTECFYGYPGRPANGGIEGTASVEWYCDNFATWICPPPCGDCPTSYVVTMSSTCPEVPSIEALVENFGGNCGWSGGTESFEAYAAGSYAYFSDGESTWHFSGDGSAEGCLDGVTYTFNAGMSSELPEGCDVPTLEVA